MCVKAGLAFLIKDLLFCRKLSVFNLKVHFRHSIPLLGMSTLAAILREQLFTGSNLITFESCNCWTKQQYLVLVLLGYVKVKLWFGVSTPL